MENSQQSYGNRKYHVGDIVGILELIEEYPEEQKWKVRCTKCGSELIIIRSTLTRYSKGVDRCKFCPFENQSPKYPNGSIYGNIKVLNYDGNNFTVQCLNCNRTFNVSRATILKYSKDLPQYCNYCKPATPSKTKYKPGEIIGNCYELIKCLGGNDWMVRCTKCGKEQSQSICNMKKHKKDVCFYCEHPYSDKPAFGRCKENMGQSIDERIYTYYKNKIEADNRKNPLGKQKPFELSLDEYSKLIHGNCYYCGEPPTEDNVWNKSGKRKMDDTLIKVNGVDRIDPNLGYISNNCVSCCPQCNVMKMDYSKEEFLNKVSQIYHKMFNDLSKDVAPSGGEMGGILIDNNLKDDEIV